MPYRNEGTGLDAPVQLLLITSRGSGRWVIPKGNVATGLAPHIAAVREAEEEAGVTGLVSPVPLGSYRYRKTRGSGASVMADVDVYPLSVSAEWTEWKEQHERERRWVSLSDAAAMVDEPDLAQLIHSFASTQFNQAARRASVFSLVAEKSKVGPMFAWFQRLLPKTGGFFELFEAHAESLMRAAEATGRLFEGQGNSADHIREINEREQDADEIIRETLRKVRETFLTPFDRGAITGLIGAMDDAIDEMQAAASAVDLYQVREFDPAMRDMAAMTIDAARLVAEAIPLLRDVGANGGRLHELTERLVRIEGHADEVHAEGLRGLFQRYGESDTLRFIVMREVYKHLERIVDAFEDVANQIDSIVIDHA